MSFLFPAHRGGIRYGTGFWPAINPRPWNLVPPKPEPGKPTIGILIDPVSVASEVASELRKIGWPGIGLMDDDFRMAVLNTPEADIPAKIEKWFVDHREEVCDTLLSRLAKYDVVGLSATAVEAMTEAVEAYRADKHLSAVRTLLPEFECFARAFSADPTAKVSQKQAISDLKEMLDRTPLMQDEPLEMFSLMHFIDDHLFKNCWTVADAQMFGPIPNRHAEMHGFASYGHLQGSSTIVCVMDLLLKMMDRLKTLGAFPHLTGGAPAAP